jgi:hypothetical protein
MHQYQNECPRIAGKQNHYTPCIICISKNGNGHENFIQKRREILVLGIIKTNKSLEEEKTPEHECFAPMGRTPLISETRLARIR